MAAPGEVPLEPEGVRPRVPARLRSGLVLGAFACCGLLGVLVAVAAPPARGRVSPPPAVTRNEPITPVPPVAASADPARAALGRALFESPLLSARGDRNCTSCHDLATNGASDAKRNMGTGGAPLPRNTNTVFNAALSYKLNWLGTADTLEQQAETVLLNPEIMGTSWPEVLRRLDADAGMAAAFRRAYGRGPDRDGVLDALATFERTLLTPDSPFDLWLEGDDGALTGRELDGYRIFKNIGCISCHQGVNVGANLFARNGIFGRASAEAPESMRVPSLRNVAVTPPYFHDGSAQTLAEAIRRMARVQLGRDLSFEQVDAILAFLQTLTGEYRGIPLRAPEGSR